MKKIVVAASLRNASPFMDRIFDNIDRLASIFDIRCVFVESDSYDNTLQKLKEFKQASFYPIDVYSFGNLASKMENRMQRICKARNFYLDVVEKEFKDYDYLYVLDFNETNIEPYDMEGVLSNFEVEEDWDMICANQEQIYYDIYALRHETWMPFNCWNAIGNRPSFMSYDQAHNMFVKSRFIQIRKSLPLIKVDSAFGGSAFIKISSIQGTRHEALDAKGEEECEWVPFCTKLNSVYINPKFINMRKLSRHIILANRVS